MRRISVSDATTFSDIRTACAGEDARNRESLVRLKETADGRVLYAAGSGGALIKARAVAKKQKGGAEFIMNAFLKQYGDQDLSRILTHIDPHQEFDKPEGKFELKVSDIRKMDLMIGNEMSRARSAGDFMRAYASALAPSILKSAANDYSEAVKALPPDQVLSGEEMHARFNEAARNSLAKFAAEARCDPHADSMFDALDSFKAMALTHADIILCAKVIDHKKIGDMRPLLAFGCAVSALEHIVPAQRTQEFLDRLFLAARHLVDDPKAFVEAAKASLPSEPPPSTVARAQTPLAQGGRGRRITSDFDEEVDSEELLRRDQAQKAQKLAKQLEYANNIEKRLPFKSWAVEQTSRLLLLSLDPLKMDDKDRKRCRINVGNADQTIRRLRAADPLQMAPREQAETVDAKIKHVVALDEAIEAKAQTVKDAFYVHLTSRLGCYRRTRMARQISSADKARWRRAVDVFRAQRPQRSESTGEAPREVKPDLKASSQAGQPPNPARGVNWRDDPNRGGGAPAPKPRGETPIEPGRPLGGGDPARDQRKARRRRLSSGDRWQSERMIAPAKSRRDAPKAPPQTGPETDSGSTSAPAEPARELILIRNRLLIALDALTTEQTVRDAEAWRIMLASSQPTEAEKTPEELKENPSKSDT